jgi:hypothetical protein
MLPASMHGDYSTSTSSTPSCFPRRTNLLGNPFLITLLHDLLSLLSFLDHHIGHPTCHDAQILLMSASSMPSEFFIIVSIYWKPASYRSSLDLSSFGKTSNRSAAKLICSFLFGPTCTLFDLSIALRLRHDLYKVVVPTPRSGACETWVPLGPHRPGSRPSPTSGSDLPEDPPTCQ